MLRRGAAFSAGHTFGRSRRAGVCQEGHSGLLDSARRSTPRRPVVFAGRVRADRTSSSINDDYDYDDDIGPHDEHVNHKYVNDDVASDDHHP